MSELKIPNDASAEARICLTCNPSKKCKGSNRCERYKEERKKIKRKKANNIVTVNKRAGGWK